MKKNNLNLATTCLATIILLTSSQIHAGWFDTLFGKKEEIVQKVEQIKDARQTASTLSDADVSTALKQALDKGVGFAITSLGKDGGFAKNPSVAIPMPSNLKKVEKALRKIGQQKYAEQFVVTMNRAAEAAVPLTADILKDSVQNMSFTDAKNILQGPDDSATRYLESTGSEQLRNKIKPIVADATDQTGVTRYYKKMLSKIDFMGNYVKVGDYDIDNYVTQKTLDGLFSKIAEQEKLIRDNPAERTTELLKTVFANP